uniref:Uncharacterized protein n=1 Tax=Oryzias latipes TaxID=8090 RepID=A0A3P9H2U4_ORYLA
MKEKLSLICDRLLSHQQIACCQSFFGIPHHGKDLLIYNILDLQQKPLLLIGHHGVVSAMTFGNAMSPVLLCSASADYIIVWDVQKCQKQTQKEAAIYILSPKTQETLSRLTGHLGPLTSAEFCPWNENVLISTSEDRTFKVWDLNTETVVYQSFVLSAFPLLNVMFLESERFLVVGSADGQVFCYSIGDNHKFSPVTKMDLQKLEKRYKVQRHNMSHEAGNSRSLQQHKGCDVNTVETLAFCKPIFSVTPRLTFILQYLFQRLVNHQLRIKLKLLNLFWLYFAL